jgi:hypothetical protein
MARPLPDGAAGHRHFGPFAAATGNFAKCRVSPRKQRAKRPDTAAIFRKVIVQARVIA